MFPAGIMAKLIHIQASPRGSRSASQAVASCFIESYCAAHPADTVDTLDLWHTDLPEINGQPHSAEQLHAWQTIVRIADRFKSADKYLVSLPMWNFSIPYKLKHYIDLLVHRGLTFSFDTRRRLQRARHRQTARSGLCSRRRLCSGFWRGKLG
jgi:FMN-dependent NADH-azoreductase